jgi:hypothetical protein
MLLTVPHTMTPATEGIQASDDATSLHLFRRGFTSPLFPPVLEGAYIKISAATSAVPVRSRQLPGQERMDRRSKKTEYWGAKFTEGHVSTRSRLTSLAQRAEGPPR